MQEWKTFLRSGQIFSGEEQRLFGSRAFNCLSFIEIPCPQSEIEVDTREAKKQTTEKRKNTNTVQSHCTHHILVLLSSVKQTSCCTQISFENTHFAPYLRFHPRRTALHDLSWFLHYLTIMYQLHTLLSVDDAY